MSNTITYSLGFSETYRTDAAVIYDQAMENYIFPHICYLFSLFQS
jgi:hypothetical protein